MPAPVKPALTAAAAFVVVIGAWKTTFLGLRMTSPIWSPFPLLKELLWRARKMLIHAL
jgi:hypothetical protein